MNFERQSLPAELAAQTHPSRRLEADLRWCKPENRSADDSPESELIYRPAPPPLWPRVFPGL